MRPQHPTRQYMTEVFCHPERSSYTFDESEIAEKMAPLVLCGMTVK